MNGHLPLHLHRTAHCTVHAVEHHKQRIAPRVDDPAAMFVNRWVDQVRAEILSRSRVPMSSNPIRRL